MQAFWRSFLFKQIGLFIFFWEGFQIEWFLKSFEIIWLCKCLIGKEVDELPLNRRRKFKTKTALES